MSGEIRASLGERAGGQTPEERLLTYHPWARAVVANSSSAAFAKPPRALRARRGWPDFWCIQPDGSLAVVEVKPKRSVGLKPQQVAVLERLAALGIAAYRDGFRRVKA
jgi:hypothetical protein